MNSYISAEALALLPRHMHPVVVAYVERGAWCDDEFFEAVLCNDLVKAWIYADDDNKKAIGGWARFLYQHMPSPAWGSREKIREWVQACGVQQFERKTG